MRLLRSICVLLLLPIVIFSQENYLSTSQTLQKYGEKISPRSFVVFTEVRERPLIWFDSLSMKKINEVVSGGPHLLSANPGEYFVFQLGIWAIHNNVSDIQIEFSSFTTKWEQSIPSSRMTCFNTSGTDYRGRSFTKRVNIPNGHVKALWVGIDLKGVSNGTYSGNISVISKESRQEIPIIIQVQGDVVPNNGYDEGKRLSRLNWLNDFTLGVDEDVTKGYTPIEVENNIIHILGRSLRVGRDGFPDLIESYFDESNQSLLNSGEQIINKSFRFVVEKSDGSYIQLSPGQLTLKKLSASRAEWSVVSSSPELDVECSALMEYDGFLEYRIEVIAKRSLTIKDIRLEVSVLKDKARYMMGLGHEGGVRKPDWRWKWDVSKNQDAIWIGAVNGGIQLKFKGENYVLPPNDSWAHKNLMLPKSWYNASKGGVRIYDTVGDYTMIKVYSGSRILHPEDKLHYNFDMLLTPLKVIDKNIKFGLRYFQDLPNCRSLPDPGYNSTRADLKIGFAKKSGANYLNIHHDVDICPFINYPCMDENIEDIKKLASDAHNEGLGLGLYYTTRFLTIHQPEFWAFNSLDNEIILPGDGERRLISREVQHPDPRVWFLKYMRGRKFYAGNSETMEEGKFAGISDLSVSTGSESRLDNFYIGYFDWMVRNLGVDGFYYDETNLTRHTLRRARKILDTYRSNGRLDIHIPGYFREGRGFATGMNLYMDMLPYFDFTWIGELQDYNRLPDHWLIEISGIPFGLPAQMLWSGGNPWRGMVYGLTKREGWKPIGVNSPVGMWKFWDDHSFSTKEMIGYWEKNSPVQCSDELVKATTYTGGGEVIIAVGNWTDKNRKVKLQIDWKQLGLNPSKVQISIPEIADFQSSKKITSLDKLVLPGGKGYIIVLK